MFYPKNVPNWERGARIVFGVVLIAMALFGSFSALMSTMLIASALFVIGTGFVGWCPACALVGRKLNMKVK